MGLPHAGAGYVAAAAWAQRAALHPAGERGFRLRTALEEIHHDEAFHADALGDQEARYA